jgi:hypothetical protein
MNLDVALTDIERVRCGEISGHVGRLGAVLAEQTLGSPDDPNPLGGCGRRRFSTVGVLK